MKCLVTGATGFVGRHLSKALAAAGHEVVGLARASGSQDGSVGFPLYAVDLLDAAAVDLALLEVRPDWLFHLAGYANAGRSFCEPEAAWSGNLQATQSLYTAIERSGLRPRILFVSSGLVYGDAEPGTPAFDELAPLQPASPYAASKAATDLLSYQQTRSPGLDIVRVRPFNQIGPKQSAEYAAANFVRQIVAIERGKQESKLVTGDLSAARDLTDVRDMVQAYIRLLEVGKSGDVFNAGSGRTYVMRDVLNTLIAMCRVKMDVEERPDPTRAKDTAVTRADTTKLSAATGWTPAYSLEQSLRDMLADTRKASGAAEAAR
ncbi:MAG: NAD-dependent epimerase/dehydratase family protein [Gemmataceae bacterium]|nr:NAD-dependent epimerase/dehydratase family protein [Gemmataceae bacterium]